MRYFAMINNECKGPFTLVELHNAGVLPDTYVWCKEMSDWQPASEVAEICRFYRQRLHDLNHPSATHTENTATLPETPKSNTQPPESSEQQRISLREFSQLLDEENEEEIEKILNPLPSNYREIPPRDMRLSAIIATLLFFFPTGLIALRMAFKSKSTWSQHSSSTDNLQADRLAKEAYDYSRSAKMWIGISFFLGIIIYPYLFFSFL